MKHVLDPLVHLLVFYTSTKINNQWISCTCMIDIAHILSWHISSSVQFSLLKKPAYAKPSCQWPQRLSISVRKDNIWRSVFHPGIYLATKTMGNQVFDSPQPNSPTVWMYSGATRSKNHPSLECLPRAYLLCWFRWYYFLIRGRFFNFQPHRLWISDKLTA